MGMDVHKEYIDTTVLDESGSVVVLDLGHECRHHSQSALHYGLRFALEGPHPISRGLKRSKQPEVPLPLWLETFKHVPIH